MKKTCGTCVFVDVCIRRFKGNVTDNYSCKNWEEMTYEDDKFLDEVFSKRELAQLKL